RGSRPGQLAEGSPLEDDYTNVPREHRVLFDVDLGHPPDHEVQELGADPDARALDRDHRPVDKRALRDRTARHQAAAGFLVHLLLLGGWTELEAVTERRLHFADLSHHLLELAWLDGERMVRPGQRA